MKKEKKIKKKHIHFCLKKFGKMKKLKIKFLKSNKNILEEKNKEIDLMEVYLAKEI
jgi:hypothetical protein